MNQLCLVASRFLNIAESLPDAYVGDCTSINLSFPSIWSIRETTSIVGKIWNKRAVNDSGYFDKILLRNSENSFGTSQD